MNKLRALIKASMSEGMHLFVYHAKDERSKKVLPIFLASCLWFAIFGYSAMMMESLKATGTEYALLSLFVIFTALMTVIEGIYKSSSLMFSCKDNDMLLAMPLKRSTIVFLRVWKFYVFEVLYNALFITPVILVYLLHAKPGAEFLVVAALMVFILPIIPVAISCVAGAISTAVSLRAKHKNLAQTVATFVFLIVVLIFSFGFNGMMDGLGSVAADLNTKIVKVYYQARAIVDLARGFSFGELIGFLAVNLAVVGAVILVMGRFYFQIVSRINVAPRAEIKGKLEFAPRKPMWAVARKEIRRYFNTPVLVSNTWIGLMLFLLAVGAACLKSDELIAMVTAEEDFPITAEQIYTFLPTATIVLVTFSSLLTYITTTMISLEREAFNTLKALPISGTKALLAKVLASLILTVPALIAGALAMAIRFRFGWVETGLILAAALILPLATELFGILVDLKYARFDAESDAEIVKQSTGVMVSAFAGLGVVVPTIAVTVAIAVVFGQLAGMLVLDGAYIIICLGLWWALKKRGEKRWQELSA